ncbi:hypothetical protein CP977_22860 [Streptomyces cinereoruber]|uniref:Uncharacterized protein n=1 Tax=Streptomyces cinereoruber TaxID=67260 RepID=A0ABX6BJB1_9ACTN|nr:hypothetical protein DBP18_12395 [Streptomyces sp. CS081A]QEV34654.1 hypothetical protein CP977_22860 [Streptomyces cinereoruber]
MDTGREQRLVAGDPLGHVGPALLGRLRVLPHHPVRLRLRAVSVTSSYAFFYLSVLPLLTLLSALLLLISYHQSPPARWWHEEPPGGGIRAMSVL